MTDQEHEAAGHKKIPILVPKNRADQGSHYEKSLDAWVIADVVHHDCVWVDETEYAKFARYL